MTDRRYNEPILKPWPRNTAIALCWNKMVYIGGRLGSMQNKKRVKQIIDAIEDPVYSRKIEWAKGVFRCNSHALKIYGDGIMYSSDRRKHPRAFCLPLRIVVCTPFRNCYMEFYLLMRIAIYIGYMRNHPKLIQSHIKGGYLRAEQLELSFFIGEPSTPEGQKNANALLTHARLNKNYIMNLR